MPLTGIATEPLAEQHPVLQWYDRLFHLQREHMKQPAVVHSMTGAASAYYFYYRLAYSLQPAA